MAKLINKYQAGKGIKYHVMDDEGKWHGMNEPAKRKYEEELRAKGLNLSDATYDWDNKQWIPSHRLNEVEIVADSPTVLRDNRGREWDFEGRDLINRMAEQYRYNAYPNMSTYYNSDWFKNHKVSEAFVGNMQGDKYIETPAPAVSDYYQTLIKENPELASALSRRGWSPEQFSRYAMSGGFERDPRWGKYLDDMTREIKANQKAKDETFLYNVRERPDYKGLNYIMMGAAALPGAMATVPMLFGEGAAYQGARFLGNVVKDMVFHPIRTAGQYYVGSKAKEGADNIVRNTTGYNTTGELVGGITGTPELNGVWDFTTSLPFYGGGAATYNAASNLVRSGVERAAPAVMDGLFGNIYRSFGVSPAYAVAGNTARGTIEGTPERFIQEMSRKSPRKPKVSGGGRGTQVVNNKATSGKVARKANNSQTTTTEPPKVEQPITDNTQVLQEQADKIQRIRQNNKRGQAEIELQNREAAAQKEAMEREIEARVQERMAQEAKSAETKLVDKPTEAKPAESKPTESKPTDTKTEQAPNQTTPDNRSWLEQMYQNSNPTIGGGGSEYGWWGSAANYNRYFRATDRARRGFNYDQAFRGKHMKARDEEVVRRFMPNGEVPAEEEARRKAVEYANKKAQQIKDSKFRKGVQFAQWTTLLGGTASSVPTAINLIKGENKPTTEQKKETPAVKVVEEYSASPADSNLYNLIMEEVKANNGQ